ncbi:MAG: hypothetical protein GC160_29770 [Acidobacteria bacterium]|nr:hypothetical protein [Acidobacteriota bacterium]
MRLLAVGLLAAALAWGQLPADRLGLYQWVSVPPSGDADLLTAARLETTELGLGAFRLYLGARFDYRRPYLAPGRFGGEIDGPVTPAAILGLPRYAAVLDDPKLSTVMLTVYESRNYGGGSDDLNLLRPWSSTDQQAVRDQIGALCELLYSRWGQAPKTVILANHEADEKLMEILQHTRGDLDRARANLVAWTLARQAAVESARAAHPEARLRVLTAFEVSILNLRVASTAGRYQKTRLVHGVTALAEVVPHIRTDLISYSSYESVNSPYETLDASAPPEAIAGRLERDLDRIREAAAGSVSPYGRELFGDRYVMLGELGFAREKFDSLPSGGVLPRLHQALQTAFAWGSPYVVLWQAFDSPRLGAEGWGYGVFDREGRPPALNPFSTGCDSVAVCLKTWAAR